MTALAVAVAAVSAVLTAAGAAKLAEPAGTGVVLGHLGVPGGPVAARLLGVGEVALGLAGLAVGGPVVLALIAAAYGAAAAVVVAARRAGLRTCGCFGSRSPRPRPLHAAIDAGCAGVAGIGAALGVAPIVETIEGRGPGSALLLIVATVLTALGLVAALLREPT